MQVVDRIEADERGEEAPVSLGDARTREVAVFGEEAFDPIQRVEQRVDRDVVSGLRGGKTGLVDAVVTSE